MLKKTFLLSDGNKYLHFPIKNTVGVYTEDKAYRYVKLLNGEKLISEIYIKLSKEPDFYAPRYFGEYDEVMLVCEDSDVPENYFDMIEIGKSIWAEQQLYSNLYNEKYRNQIHFSAARGWLNDPNGLLFHDGKFHMYFQHNPLGTVHGGVNVSWGHAESTDGIFWKEKNVAIYNRNAEQIVASGSAWCDEENIFGFGKNVIISAHTELNAYYFKGPKQPQTEGQFLMISYDGGNIFENLGKNPKVTVAKDEFWRDPKLLVIDKTMYMLVYERYEEQDCVTVYSSENLDEWKFCSRSMDLYECPDLFRLPVEETGEEKWILYGGNGNYSLCNFENCVIEKLSDGGFMDYGWSVYAGQTFNNHPDKNCRYHIAWVVHGWDNDFTDYPGKKFSQCMSLMCRLSLHKTKQGYRLFRAPCKEIENLRYNDTKGKVKDFINLSAPCEIIVDFNENKDFSHG